MNFRKYVKIHSIWKRAREGVKKGAIIPGEYSRPEFEMLEDCLWEASEKIDGTNIRIMWDAEEGRVEFGGKTERAQIPADLVNLLRDIFYVEKFQEADVPSMVIFGEGYGNKIQKRGKLYNPDGVDFIGFDVWCGDLWLERANVVDIAGKMEFNLVKDVGPMTLADACMLADKGLRSDLANITAEGIVLRAPGGILNRRGERLICKIKTADYDTLRQKQAQEYKKKNEEYKKTSGGVSVSEALCNGTEK